ncbi:MULTISPECIES: high-affinity branched-chain amino acid ABC transporter permease LivM [Acidocella]|uniref:high-affinity branched-chain amino acid ABC transporter permease LivM n=1 Tax=Acidocella TaxID=50709 RepID=UPI00028E8C4D|nr:MULTISPECIES: high-affinity branched-chain amino acid ABC transporter permease LivM [Acidocella]EKN01042.1 High-affinity branched-chain amino acid transport system permease protein LivM (LIV-I protein M) [Acidocella sp. MX-AZ02]WBO60640.1 high-affinity branched-chain amino acid ABC transporter permease LivM [Acidocella sp. MX-AZ03]
MLEDLKDAGLCAFFALLIFAPFLGVHLGDGTSGNLTLGPTPERLALAVAATFIARMAMLAWHRLRGKRTAKPSNGAAAARAAKYIGPVLLAVAIIFPLLPGMPNAYIDLGVLILTYVMLGWGLNIVVGLAGLLDLGYVAFYAVGAYSFALLASNFGLGFWECLPLAGILAAFWGVCLGFPVLRLRGDYLAIVTLAFGEIIRLVITNWVSLTGGPNGLLGMPAPSLFGLKFSMAGGPGTFAGFFGVDPMPWQKTAYLFYVILALALLTNWVTLRLRKQPLGRAWEALREDEIACRSLGINVRNTKLTAFAIGAMFGGFAGCFFAARQSFISPDSFTFIESATVLAIVVLGGAGSQLGVVLAACVMIGIPELLQSLQIYRMLIFGLALVTIMVVRPRGFISIRRPSVSLGKAKMIGAELRAEGKG